MKLLSMEHVEYFMVFLDNYELQFPLREFTANLTPSKILFANKISDNIQKWRIFDQFFTCLNRNFPLRERINFNGTDFFLVSLSST